MVSAHSPYFLLVRIQEVVAVVVAAASPFLCRSCHRHPACLLALPRGDSDSDSDTISG